MNGGIYNFCDGYTEEVHGPEPEPVIYTIEETRNWFSLSDEDFGLIAACVPLATIGVVGGVLHALGL